MNGGGARPEGGVIDDPAADSGCLDLQQCSAHWVRRDVMAWRRPIASPTGEECAFELVASGRALLGMPGSDRGAVTGADVRLPLAPMDPGEQYAALAKFPHLLGCTLLRVPEARDWPVDRLVKTQLAVTRLDEAGRLLEAAGVQVAGVLDDAFAYFGPLGHGPGPAGPKLRLWAPTAVRVELVRWEGPRGGQPEVAEMAEEAGQGVWSLDVPEGWMWQFYRYRVTAYRPETGRVETVELTDPYSRGLAANGERTQMVDLDHGMTKPEGWDVHERPGLESFCDVSVYELHVRDFSATDAGVPEALRGKYAAFSPARVGRGNGGRLSAGLKHLAELRSAGMNHVHLLPTYDFATVPEREDERAAPPEDMSQFGSASEEQQRLVSEVADRDAYNWGYDPVHFGVPEGSYSTEPDGLTRIMEFREMVMGLHSLGYRVVLDVVYNHTFASGPHSPFSVLDKAVPGYYHRREENGDVCGSACGANTASEHVMFDRLVVDDVVHWAVNYKVDGFRFDIMGCLMLDTMRRVRQELDSLTVEKDGVDGKKIYLYGEGWDHGEASYNQRGRNANQLNTAGLGIGCFNDRFRDSMMGGSPFTPARLQGVATGLGIEPNASAEQEPADEQKDALAASTAKVMLSLAGNLADYKVQLGSGEWVRGYDLKHHGLPVGYCRRPEENVVYVGCHDNFTLFDQVILKASSGTGVSGRAGMCEVALAAVLLAQGVPFVHAGDDLLRSKSLDRDSYNSGDWFNKVDWTCQASNFGVGLPPAEKNFHQWVEYGALLDDPTLVPTPECIQQSAQHMKLFLRIRYSSPLFRMQSADQICRQVHFRNTGPAQVPGVIVTELESSEVPDDGAYDPHRRRLLTIFNFRPDDAIVKDLWGNLELHPILRDSPLPRHRQCTHNSDAGEVLVPGRTAAVFEERR